MKHIPVPLILFFATCMVNTSCRTALVQSDAGASLKSVIEPQGKTWELFYAGKNDESHVCRVECDSNPEGVNDASKLANICNKRLASITIAQLNDVANKSLDAAENQIMRRSIIPAILGEKSRTIKVSNMKATAAMARIRSVFDEELRSYDKSKRATESCSLASEDVFEAVASQDSKLVFEDESESEKKTTDSNIRVYDQFPILSASHRSAMTTKYKYARCSSMFMCKTSVAGTSGKPAMAERPFYVFASELEGATTELQLTDIASARMKHAALEITKNHNSGNQGRHLWDSCELIGQVDYNFRCEMGEQESTRQDLLERIFVPNSRASISKPEASVLKSQGIEVSQLGDVSVLGDPFFAGDQIATIEMAHAINESPKMKTAPNELFCYYVTENGRQFIQGNVESSNNFSSAANANSERSSSNAYAVYNGIFSRSSSGWSSSSSSDKFSSNVTNSNSLSFNFNTSYEKTGTIIVPSYVENQGFSKASEMIDAACSYAARTSFSANNANTLIKGCYCTTSPITPLSDVTNRYIVFEYSRGF